MTISHGAHCDNVNQQFSVIGVQGTLGTADVGGTALTLPIGVNPTNGGMYTNSFMVGTDGTPFAFINNAGAPQICAQPYLQALAEGDISGHSPWMKMGYTPSLGTADSDLWSYGGNINLPGTGIQMSVLSSSVDDTSLGNGVKSVKINYLDNSYIEKSTTVIMSGTAPVNTTPTDILRVNSFRVETAGTNGKAVGNITLKETGAGTTVYSYISTGYTRARNSSYTVPVGKTLYIVQFVVGFGYAANQTHYSRIYTRATQNEGIRTPNIFYPFTEVVCANTSQEVTLEIPTKIVEKVDVKVSGISSFTGVASVALRGWLE